MVPKKTKTIWRTQVRKFHFSSICNVLPCELRLLLVFDKGSQPTLGQQITDMRPTVRPTVGRQTANSRPTAGRKGGKRQSADCRPTVGRLSADCWPTVVRLSSDCRPTVVRLSSNCRPTVGRLLANCRPTVFWGSCSSLFPSFESLSFQFRIGKTTVGNIVLEVCSAIYDSLREEFLQTPNQIHKWQKIAGHFHSRWNIPNDFGAIDGKRIVILKPAHSGSHFKGNESIIALVIAGPEYECLYADVGTNGRNPDGHAWSRCSLKKALDNPDNLLNIPPDEPLPGRTKPIPFVLTGDEAFPLSRYMLKPYPNRNLNVEQRIANYRISRGRRISEKIF